MDVFLNTDAGGKLTTQLYDKRDDFNFAIVSFSFIYVYYSNIPLSPAYCVYISQMIRYARTILYIRSVLSWGRLLTDKLITGISTVSFYVSVLQGL
jgi:hypothetical protein